MWVRRTTAALLGVAALMIGMNPAQAKEGDIYAIHPHRDTTYAFTVPTSGYTVTLQKFDTSQEVRKRQNFIEGVHAEGYFQLKSQAYPEYCLAIGSGNANNKLIVWKCDPKIRDQWWKWMAPASGGKQLENRETKRVVGPDEILPNEEIVQFDPKDSKADLTTTRAHKD